MLHWSIAGVIFLLILGSCASRSEKQGVVIHTTADSIYRVIQQGDVVVLDVRPKEKYEQGHIPGAIHMDLMDSFETRIQSLKARKVVVYCGNGQRSLQASQILQEYGIDTVYNLAKGLPEWVQAGLPVED